MSGLDMGEMHRAELALVGDIYEAAINPARWQSVISAAASAMGGSSGLVYGLQSAQPDLGWFGHRFPASAMERYAAYYQQTNIWAHEIDRRQIAVGAPVLTDALVDANTLERSEFYADYLNELDIHRACTVLLHRDEQTRSESHLCVYRSRTQSAFDERAQALMRALVPHLQRAQRMSALLVSAEQSSRSAFATIDKLAVGVVLLSASGAVLRLNRAAEAIVREGDGVSMAHGRLAMARPDDLTTLARLVRQASARAGKPAVGGGMNAYRPSGKPSLHVTVSPLPERDGLSIDAGSGAAVLVTLSGHESQTADARGSLAQLFGLTPAEARVAVGLVAGLSSAEIASAGAVSINTVRTQMAALMAKTGAHRQAEIAIRLRGACGTLHDFPAAGPD